MKKGFESDGHLIRSGTRLRESVRCLPKGHFQQIREMFDRQSNVTKSNLSRIHHHRQQQLKPKLFPSYVLLKLPVTDDEKWQHSTTRNLVDIVAENDKPLKESYSSPCQISHAKFSNISTDHPSVSLKQEEHSSTVHSTIPIESNFYKDTLSNTTSSSRQFLSSTDREKSVSTFEKYRQLAMATAVNYADSYESSSTSNHFSRLDSTRQCASNLQRTLAVHAKPVLVKTTRNILKHNAAKKDENNNTSNNNNNNNNNNNLFPSSSSLHSSPSLSSTGYDSNSSPSMISIRNSLITNPSSDLSLSSNECQPLKSWILHESGINTPVTIPDSYSNDDIFDSMSLISRSHIKLNDSPTSTVEHQPITIIRQAIVHNSFMPDSPSISSTSSSSPAKYIVQTTSFPNKTTKNRKTYSYDRTDTPCFERKQILTSSNPVSFPIQRQLSIHSPVVAQQQNNQRDESPLPIVENPLFQQIPPRKPPRTFEYENRYDHLPEINSRKVASSSSSSTRDSPMLDLGTRSASCMNLTAGVANAFLLTGLLPLDDERINSIHQPNILSDSAKEFVSNENIYEELKTPISTINKDDVKQFLFNSNESRIMKKLSNDTKFHTPTIKTETNRPWTSVKSGMKKGVSEPNLTKIKPSSSLFSPRGLIDRFKRILPLSISKQSLNEKSVNKTNSMTIESDDSLSTSSENNDDFRISRLDHVSRVKNAYDTLGAGSQMTSLFTDPNRLNDAQESATLYDYVVHILPEQEIGCIANGNGCLSSSHLNFNQEIGTSTWIRFKYPLNAKDEISLKYFCFPEQPDSNNNHTINSFLSFNKSKPDYYRFTLTDMRGTRQHGYCSRFFHKGILNALCIISSYDMINLYEKILSTAAELFLSYKDEDAKVFLKEIYPHRLPNRGDTIHIHTVTVGLYTLKCEYDHRKQLIDSITLLSLSTDTIIKIFSSILYEQKLIFIANELGPLTRLINTFICLLYPFSWPHTYVPILPGLMLDIIQAPTPYIVGILRSSEYYLSQNDEFLSQDNSDMLIVDVDHDRIRSINDYLPNESYRESVNSRHNNLSQYQILPKIFKIELKQEISLLRKNKLNLSLDDRQQCLQNVFMSIFVQSCYNYKDYLTQSFNTDHFIQSKQHSIALFLEWFTRTQIFELFIRQKLDLNIRNQFAITFDVACEKYRRTLKKQTSQRVTVKSVKRRAAIRANRQENRF